MGLVEWENVFYMIFDPTYLLSSMFNREKVLPSTFSTLDLDKTSTDSSYNIISETGLQNSICQGQGFSFREGVKLRPECKHFVLINIQKFVKIVKTTQT